MLQRSRVKLDIRAKLFTSRVIPYGNDLPDDVFPSLVRRSNEQSPITTEVSHHIVTRGPPVHALSSRRAPDKLRTAHAELQHMLNMGTMRPVDSGGPISNELRVRQY
ncbi:unnamed protein product [Echinostoma caproni]|uniref:Uncharacterized protein n=1 Tax=Echinostoma caproni TaxID=27848 RepID=A0A183B8Q5_9TREM|nr:unnamed protein product [Echinostoma caproni]